MKQVFIQHGQAVVEDVPAPQVEAGTIVVQVDHSCISAGTEMSGVKSTADPLWLRALKDPRKVVKAAKMVTTKGLTQTKMVVKGAISVGYPTGYSAAGTVLEVGEGIIDIQVGDRVACAGAQCAHHAEIIRVPRNLAIRIPDSVGLDVASTVTLGAIAMQGVRRASPTLGESFVVLGLGILGQLTVQMLKANGCRVIGTDLQRDRITLAKELGMDVGIHPDDGDSIEQVARLTDGYGADGVIITAATPSDAVMSTAFKMCRRKGRVVLVGDVGLNLNRADFYQKELDFFISTSYGPGRYDRSYEEDGHDYPISYVRWTENRNMVEYLRLLSDGQMDIKPLIHKVMPVEQANVAYDSLRDDENRPLIVLLSYPNAGSEAAHQKVIANPLSKAAGAGQIRMAIVGAGGFAKGMHLPNMQALNHHYHVQAIMSRTAHNAASTAKLYHANYSTTDYEHVLNDKDVDAVLISTRHNTHGEMVLSALHAGKHVLVEKPLALTSEELEAIEAFYQQAESDAQLPILLTGFNRRFSPFAKRIRELTKDRGNPMILNYRMNAGHIPLDHWVHTDEGGGRNRGEACHIYDLFTYLVDSPVKGVHAQKITPANAYYSNQDNFVATMTFEDGSVATLTYTALGSKSYPKEHLEIYVDGKVFVLEDYQSLEIYGMDDKGITTKATDKGHKTELVEFAQNIQQGGAWAIPLWHQAQATQIALQVEDFLSG